MLENANDLISIEHSIKSKIDAYGRELYRSELQKIVAGTPPLGSDGGRLSAGRIQSAKLLTPYGMIELNVFCGRCEKTGRFEVPFKTRFCRGRRCAMTPLAEHRIVTTPCETGSYEKCAKVCAEWGCEISDGKVMDVIGDIGRDCSDSDLPALCEDAARKDDILIVSMDGWMARFRGVDWGESGKEGDGHVDWHEIKSAVMYSLSQVTDISNERRWIEKKHIVCAEPGTSPEEFAQQVEREATRMGLLRASKRYFIMAGGTYLWNIFDMNFSTLADGTLDYYHATQHLGVLAEHLFPSEINPDKQKAWLLQRCHELKHSGPSNLMKAISEIDLKDWTVRKQLSKSSPCLRDSARSVLTDRR